MSLADRFFSQNGAGDYFETNCERDTHNQAESEDGGLMGTRGSTCRHHSSEMQQSASVSDGFMYL